MINKKIIKDRRGLEFRSAFFAVIAFVPPPPSDNRSGQQRDRQHRRPSGRRIQLCRERSATPGRGNCTHNSEHKQEAFSVTAGIGDRAENRRRQTNDSAGSSRHPCQPRRGLCVAIADVPEGLVEYRKEYRQHTQCKCRVGPVVECPGEHFLGEEACLQGV